MVPIARPTLSFAIQTYTCHVPQLGIRRKAKPRAVLYDGIASDIKEEVCAGGFMDADLSCRDDDLASFKPCDIDLQLSCAPDLQHHLVSPERKQQSLRHQRLCLVANR